MMKPRLSMPTTESKSQGREALRKGVDGEAEALRIVPEGGDVAEDDAGLGEVGDAADAGLDAVRAFGAIRTRGRLADSCCISVEAAGGRFNPCGMPAAACGA